MNKNTLIEADFGLLLWTFLSVTILILVVYFVIKFYKRVMTYLDKSIKLIDKKLNSE